MKKIFLLFTGIIALADISAQGRKELLRYADDAFKKGDYLTAAGFYLSVLNKNTDDEVRTYPFEVRGILIPEKAKNDTLQPTSVADTAKKDSVLVPVKDTVVKTPEVKSIVTDIKDQYVIHQLAESYRLNHDYANAEKWYATSVASEPKSYPEECYWYGLTLMNNEKYDQAVEQFEKYVAANPGSQSSFVKNAEKRIFACYFAKDPRSLNPEVLISELDSVVNAGSTSLAPVFYGEKNSLAFASANPMGTGTEKVAPEFILDVFTSEKNGLGWEKPVKLENSVNTFLHEQPGAFTPDKQKFYFSRWMMNPSGKKEHAIYMSRFLNNHWLQPVKLNENVNAMGYISMNPALNIDGSRLFFSSNRPNGKGKMDIWCCIIDELGNAGPPMNLGYTINTPEDEVTPFYDPLTMTLYFSSDGHAGFGGLDIFRCFGDEDDTLWSSPVNMKGPINSSKDDAYFIVYKDQSVGYFASDRKSCAGCAGGACYKIYALEKGPAMLRLTGTVYDKKTKAVLPNTLITIKDVADGIKPLYIITDEEGKYKTVLLEDVNYYLKAQKSKFFADQAHIATVTSSNPVDIVQDFYLDPIPSGDIVIPGIEYDFDKATLRPRSKLILDTLAMKLELNDNLVVELSSHTDARGNDEYNLKLSDLRAKSVVDYLISKGIGPERLIPKGCGETMPLIKEEEIEKMATKDETEAAHQKNRRTAFKVLKETELKMK